MLAALDEAAPADARGAATAPDAVIVVILPDGGRNYLSKLYNDEWMRANGLLPTTGRRRAGRGAARATATTAGRCPTSSWPARPTAWDGDRPAPALRDQPAARCPSSPTATRPRRASWARSARRACSTARTATRDSWSARSARSWTGRCRRRRRRDRGRGVRAALRRRRGPARGPRRPPGGRRHQARPARVPRPPADVAEPEAAGPVAPIPTGVRAVSMTDHPIARPDLRPPRGSARIVPATCPTRSAIPSSGSRMRSIRAQPWLGRAIVPTEPAARAGSRLVRFRAMPRATAGSRSATRGAGAGDVSASGSVSGGPGAEPGVDRSGRWSVRRRALAAASGDALFARVRRLNCPAFAPVSMRSMAAGMHDADPAGPRRPRDAFATRAVHAGAEPDEADRRRLAADLPDLDLRPGRRRPAARAATSTRAARTRPASGSSAPSRTSRAAATASRSPAARRRPRPSPSSPDRARRSSSATTSTAARSATSSACTGRPARRGALRRPRRRARTRCGRRSTSARAWSGSSHRRTRCSRSPTSRPSAHRPRASAPRRGAAAAARRRQHVRLARAPAAARARAPTSCSTPRRSTSAATRTRSSASRSRRTTRSPSGCASCRTRWARVPGPFDCFLVLRGLRTLAPADGAPLRERAWRSRASWPRATTSPRSATRAGRRAHAHPRPRGRRRQMRLGGEPAFGGMVSFVAGAGRRARPDRRRAGDRRLRVRPACSRSRSRWAASSR